MLALAREVGVSELTISRLERLNKHPKVATLHKIAGALDTSVSALLESEEQS